MRLFAASAAWILMSVSVGGGGIVYSQNFEGGGPIPEWSGAGSVSSTGGLSAFGFGNLHLRNDTTSASVLTLTGLGSHTTISLTFDLAIWDSVDQGSDQFVITQDGNGLVSTTSFGNYFGAADGPGTLITDPFSSFAVPDYGYNSSFRDQGRHVVLSFAHSAPSLTLLFQFPNSQGSSDESFGLDNVVVESDATGTPEPASVALTAAGVALLATRLRYRR